MKKIKQIVTSIAFVLCLGALTPIYAGNGDQGNGNGNGNGGNGNGNQGNGNGNGGGATVPINRGLIILLVAGVAIGGYALYKKNTKELIKNNNA